jgi:hypothetical protein
VSECSVAGTVRKGTFVPEPPAPWLVWLGKHEGQRVIVTAATEKQRRSTKQNRRYWSLVVPVAAEVLGAGREVPLSKDQAHEVLKFAFLGHEQTALGPVPKSSKDLTTAEFADYCRRIEEWFLHQHGIVMPENEAA